MFKNGDSKLFDLANKRGIRAEGANAHALQNSSTKLGMQTTIRYRDTKTELCTSDKVMRLLRSEVNVLHKPR